MKRRCEGCAHYLEEDYSNNKDICIRNAITAPMYSFGKPTRTVVIKGGLDCGNERAYDLDSEEHCGKIGLYWTKRLK